MSEYSGVAVVCERNGDSLARISTEGLGIGRQLADALGTKLAAVIPGSGVAALADEATALGADVACLVDDPLLAEYETDACIHAVGQAVDAVKPALLIFGQTDIGRDLAPRLAFRLGTSATLDCVQLAVENGRLLATKPVYGGNALAVYTSGTDPQIVAIRSKAFTALEPDASRRGETMNVPAALESVAVRTKTVDRIVEEAEGIRLEDAAVVIAGGRGIGGEEGFKRLQELAALLHGAVGSSRPPCDNGWIPDTTQVGLTGKIIAPDLYIAVAISGSSQHLSGCSGARTIVAVNKDKEANIFRHARYGVVGDWKQVLPAFIGKVKELVS
jgi:electron transfer flavoprotein alpha subunit